jgi:MFS transporter, MCT family, solute carrier family 16 (monocarboxylic acid transporters), member 3
MTLPSGAFTSTSTVSLLVLTNAVSAPARILIGYLADFHIGPLNAFILAVASFAATLFGWTGVRSAAGMYVWAAAFGITNGAAQGAFVAGAACLTSDPAKAGVRFGMICAVVAFGVLAGPPLAGAVIDGSGGSYLWAQVWGGCALVVAVLVLAVGRWCRHRRFLAFV